MPKSLPSELRFLDGAVLSKHYIAIAARPVALDDDAENTRAFGFADGGWFYIDLEMIVWSVCATQKPVPSVYYVGRDGRVHVVRKGGVQQQEIIEDAGHEPQQFGYLFDAQEIDGTVYVCGEAGQIYRRDPSGWIHFDSGPLDRRGVPEAAALYGIDGSSERDIYAVGEAGLIWHFDGLSWTRMAPPTAADLNGVRCVSPKEVYLSGDDGVFLKGYLDRWEAIPVPARTGDFTAVEHFEGKTYLAASAGILEYDGTAVQRTVTGLEVEPDAFRFDANDGVLWSFGNKHLCFFNGKKWTYVKHPDNPE